MKRNHLCSPGAAVSTWQPSHRVPKIFGCPPGPCSSCHPLVRIARIADKPQAAKTHERLCKPVQRPAGVEGQLHSGGKCTLRTNALSTLQTESDAGATRRRGMEPFWGSCGYVSWYELRGLVAVGDCHRSFHLRDPRSADQE
jgi:hypothetical protein